MMHCLETRRMLSAYFVDPSAGSDLNDGLTPATAWASLDKVNGTSFAAGDQIRLAAGRTHAGTLRLGTDDPGTAADPITINSYGDSTGDGLETLADRATISAGNAAGGISVLNTAGVVVSGLNVAGSGTQANASFNGIEFDNNQSGDVKLSHVRVSHVDVSGFGKYGIHFGGSNGKSGFDDVRIEYVDVHHNTLGGIASHGVFSATATGYANTNVYVGHARVHHNPGYAGSPNHSGSGIVLSDIDGVVIERSEAFENGAANTHVGGPVGIWVWDVNDALVQHNESHHNRTNSTADGGGFDFDGGVTNSVMQYNYSHDNDGAGYGIYQFAGARPFYNNHVRYNVSARDGRKNTYGAIDVWNGNGANGIRDTHVYNNTVYVTPSVKTTTTYDRKGNPVTTTTKAGDPRALRILSPTTNLAIRNNIFQTTGGQMLADVQARHTNLQIQGNDWWSTGAAFSAKVMAKVYTSFSAFVTGTGHEKLGTTVVGKNLDPRMVNPGAVVTVGNPDALESSLGDFKLQATSPLRGAGLNVWARFAINPGSRDLFGTALPTDPAAMSAFAYGVGAHQST
ncbi:MAG TPA: hypothetical protein VEA69_07345 [Tepidisphaeraceae bacterium]|nr:hypothetical protein [Tepidisphaeraceae bacterium]